MVKVEDASELYLIYYYEYVTIYSSSSESEGGESWLESSDHKSFIYMGPLLIVNMCHSYTKLISINYFHFWATASCYDTITPQSRCMIHSRWCVSLIIPSFQHCCLLLSCDNLSLCLLSIVVVMLQVMYVCGVCWSNVF